MLAPLSVEDVEDHLAFQLAHGVLAHLLLAVAVVRVNVGFELVKHVFAF